MKKILCLLVAILTLSTVSCNSNSSKDSSAGEKITGVEYMQSVKEKITEKQQEDIVDKRCCSKFISAVLAHHDSVGQTSDDASQLSDDDRNRQPQERSVILRVLLYIIECHILAFFLFRAANIRIFLNFASDYGE